MVVARKVENGVKKLKTRRQQARARVRLMRNLAANAISLSEEMIADAWKRFSGEKNALLQTKTREARCREMNQTHKT